MSAPTPALRSAVAAAIAELGDGTRIVRTEPLGGGCVSPAARIVTDRAESFFLKWNAHAPPGLFEAEADGLRALERGAEGTPLRVPAVLGVDAARGDAPAWLLLEWVDAGAPAPDFAARLGEGLAALHRTGAAGRWGWERDNFIGPLPQRNAGPSDWGGFWRDARLAPQLERALGDGRFGGDADLLERVLDLTPALLADVEGTAPSLLHGDLWGGNVQPDRSGRPVIFDPAAYRGHHEVDLAMSELFGGFPDGWPDAYAAAATVEPAYRNHRRGLYQLYYLLVHVNLFGSGYEAACLRAAREALRGA